MNRHDQILECKTKIRDALKQLEEATGEVVEDVSINRYRFQALEEVEVHVLKGINITFKEKAVEGWS